MRLIAKIIAILLLLTLPVVNAGLVEYRNVVFYPNGTQEIFKDFLLANVTEEYGLTLNYTKVINISSPGNYEFDLEKKAFNISVMIYAKERRVFYEIRNNYTFTLNISANITNTSGVPICGINCLNVVREGKNIRAGFSIPPTSTARLYIIPQSSGYFKVGNSYLSFSFNETAIANVTKPVLVSINKSYDSVWIANFSVKNVNNVSVYADITTWYEVKGKKHHLGNYSTIIPAKATWNSSATVDSSHVPTFYILCRAVNSSIWSVRVKPVHPANLGNPNKDLLDDALVLGLTLYIPPGAGGGAGGGEAPVTTPAPTATPPATPTQPPATPVATPSVTPPVTPPPTFTVRPVSVSKSKAIVISLSSTVPLLFMLVPSLLVFRRADVVDRGVFRLEEIGLFGNIVYIPVRCELGRILPGGATLVIPNPELARDIHEVFDIPLRSAEAIAIALERNARVFLSDRKAYEIAVMLGLEAVYLI